MTPLIVDIIWLLFAGGLVWFIFERKKPKGKQSTTSILIIAFVSWFVFKVLHRAVITSKGTQVDALLVGALFGGIILVICVGIKWVFTKKKMSQT
jgi:fructose-specific phosphotransferase system IIC component